MSILLLNHFESRLFIPTFQSDGDDDDDDDDDGLFGNAIAFHPPFSLDRRVSIQFVQARARIAAASVYII